MISTISASEVSELSHLGRWFHYKTHPEQGEFNADVFSGAWEKMINDGNGWVMARQISGIMAEAIGCYIYPDIHTGAKTGMIGFWFVSDIGRTGLASGMLFKSVMDKLTADRVLFVHIGVNLGDSEFQKVVGFVTKIGFGPTEMHYVKKLEQW